MFFITFYGIFCRILKVANMTKFTLFLACRKLLYRYYSYIRLFWTSNTWFSKMKSHMWKNWTVFNILVITQLILKVLQLKFLELVLLLHLYLQIFDWHKNSKTNKTSNFFDNFFGPKTVFWKKLYWVATTIDCLEPIFGFLEQFCFQKHRSDTWDPKGMFSALSGRSAKDSIAEWPIKK